MMDFITLLWQERDGKEGKVRHFWEMHLLKVTDPDQEIFLHMTCHKSTMCNFYNFCMDLTPYILFVYQWDLEVLVDGFYYLWLELG